MRDGLADHLGWNLRTTSRVSQIKALDIADNISRYVKHTLATESVPAVGAYSPILSVSSTCSVRTLPDKKSRPKIANSSEPPHS